MTEFEKYLPFHIAASRAIVAIASDTLNWSHPELEWRIRFDLPDDANENPGRLRKFVAPGVVMQDVLSICPHGSRVGTMGVYVRDFETVRTLFVRYGDWSLTEPRIVTIQSRTSWNEANRIATSLAEGLRGDPRHPGPPLTTADITDLSWVERDDAWTCECLGHSLACVREGGAWTIAVDGEAACSRAVSREAASSKWSVANAIHRFRANERGRKTA